MTQSYLGFSGSAMSFGMVLVCTALAELCVLRRLRFDWLVVAMVLAGTVVCVDYLTYTSVSERNYDGPAHVEYIKAIADHLRVPDAFACVACGHPPLYYALAALWSKVVLVGGWMPFELGLQWLSLLLFSGFVVFSLLILRSCNARPTTLRLAAALVVFWPSSIINSVRVHNDALASLLMVAAMYFIAQWDGHGRPRDFYAALAASALALLTKSTGYAVAATLAFFAVLHLRSTRPRRESIRQGVTAILVLAAAAALAIGFHDSRRPRTLCQKAFGHACDGRYVPAVPDRPSRFIYFDVPEFVRGTGSMPDDPERDYFLNRLAKSSLFGVIPLGDEFGGRRHQTLAVFISLLLLAMVMVCVAALPLMRGASLRKYRVYLGAAVIMFIFLLAFRIRLPNEFHEDFRHIFPALVPFCLGYATIVERLGRFSKILHYAGVAMGLLMVAASVAFFARIP
jgi:hypothetical protein